MELLIGFEPMTCALRVKAERKTVPKPNIILPVFLSFGTNSFWETLLNFYLFVRQMDDKLKYLHFIILMQNYRLILRIIFLVLFR